MMKDDYIKQLIKKLISNKYIQDIVGNSALFNKINDATHNSWAKSSNSDNCDSHILLDD